MARNQRERLFGAMVAVVSQRGYEAATVEDLVRLSGVSRSTFYEHFANKEACFLEAVDVIIEASLRTVAEAVEVRGPWDRRLRAAVETIADLIVAQPAAARMCLVDVYAAGASGAERVERVTSAVAEMVRRDFRDSPERAGMPLELVRGVIGGWRKVVQTRLRLGREEELVELVPQLWEWMACYRTPPRRLRRPRRRPAASGRPGPRPHDQVGRIHDAVATVVEQKGYPAMTVADIVSTASVSLTTFYAHFRSKEEALLAAFDRLQADALAATLPAYNRAPDWPHAVRDGLHALVAYTAMETKQAYLGHVGMYAAGLRALERRDAALEAFQAAMAPGYELAPATCPIAAEGVGGAIYSLLYDHVLRRGPETAVELGPLVTFVALAPFVGVEAACAIANEMDRGRRPAHDGAPARGDRARPRTQRSYEER